MFYPMSEAFCKLFGAEPFITVHLMGISKNVYCMECGQSFISSSNNQCSLCNASATLIDPESPEALRDMMLRRQQDARTGTKSWGEFFLSIVDTCLLSPWWAMSALMCVIVLIAITVLSLNRDTPGNEQSVTEFEVIATLLFLLASAKLAICSVVLWLTWRQVVAMNAAESRERQV